MKVIDVIDHPDGSATFILDLTKKERNIFFLDGLQRFIDKLIPKTFIVIPYKKKLHKKINKTIDLTDSMENSLIEFGFIELLKEHIEKNKLNKRKKNK